MVYDYFDKYTFLCEMYDVDVNAFIDLILNYYPFDNSCQVINPEKGKSLLKRVHLPTLTLDMLQVGNIVNVFSKLLLIKDCAPATGKSLFEHYESTFALIKPLPANLHGKVITFIMKKGFQIHRMKNGKVTKEFGLKLYQGLSGNSVLPLVIDYVTSGEVIGLELVAPNAVEEWKRCLGATDPETAAPGTLRRMLGVNILRNVAHACESTELTREMLDLFFGYENGLPRVPFKATFENCTCCVILPHAILDGNLGNILEHISTSGKFTITAMAMFSVNLPNAEEFYEVYKGVITAVEGMAVELVSGKCVALEVKCVDPNMNCVCEFRKLCGPRDPDLCRQLYPDSIRAIYGKTTLQNAVHCTDLPEDGVNEVEYFFRFLTTE